MYLELAVAVDGALEAQGTLADRSEQAAELVRQTQRKKIFASVPEVLGRLSLDMLSESHTLIKKAVVLLRREPITSVPELERPKKTNLPRPISKTKLHGSRR